MTRIEEIERAVTELQPEELARFRAWFAEFDADAWDQQLAADVATGRLDSLAEEALQDTFVAVWRSARGYHGTGDVPAWLWGIARRRLASLTRRQRPGRHS